MTTQSTMILGLMAETSIHAGTGQSVGAIDLPIQREAHTDWPCVFGSAVKGALRTRAEQSLCSETPDPVTKVSTRSCDPALYSVFGPDTDKASEHAGALMVGDARIVLLPVRSLTTQFKWVTCPAVLQRLARDADRLGLQGFDCLKDTSEPSGGDENACPAWTVFVDEISGLTQEVYLEEYKLKVSELPQKTEIIDALALLSDRSNFKEALGKQLVIVENDLFRDICRHATPVNAHVQLDSTTKTVKGGALWYEETLPPDTLLYTWLIAGSSRRRKLDSKGYDVGPEKMSSVEVMAVVTRLFAQHSYLQLGGNETLGMGWCRVNSCNQPKPGRS